MVNMSHILIFKVVAQIISKVQVCGPHIYKDLYLVELFLVSFSNMQIYIHILKPGAKISHDFYFMRNSRYK